MSGDVEFSWVSKLEGDELKRTRAPAKASKRASTSPPRGRTEGFRQSASALQHRACTGRISAAAMHRWTSFVLEASRAKSVGEAAACARRGDQVSDDPVSLMDILPIALDDGQNRAAGRRAGWPVADAPADRPTVWTGARSLLRRWTGPETVRVRGQRPHARLGHGRGVLQFCTDRPWRSCSTSARIRIGPKCARTGSKALAPSENCQNGVAQDGAPVIALFPKSRARILPHQHANPRRIEPRQKIGVQVGVPAKLAPARLTHVVPAGVL